MFDVVKSRCSEMTSRHLAPFEICIGLLRFVATAVQKLRCIGLRHENSTGKGHNSPRKQEKGKPQCRQSGKTRSKMHLFSACRCHDCSVLLCSVLQFIGSSIDGLVTGFLWISRLIINCVVVVVCVFVCVVCLSVCVRVSCVRASKACVLG